MFLCREDRYVKQGQTPPRVTPPLILMSGHKRASKQPPIQLYRQRVSTDRQTDRRMISYMCTSIFCFQDPVHKPHPHLMLTRLTIS